MAQKKSRSGQRNPATPTSRRSSFGPFLAAGLIVIAGAIWVLRSGPEPEPAPAVDVGARAPMAPVGSRDEAPPPTPPMPETVTVAEDLPPLPLFYQPARPIEVTRAVYEFAARRPDVLRYVPCFCGCERDGHRDNEDCFVAGRAADGRVSAWDPHGLG